MPNWCQNRVEIFAKEDGEDINKIIKIFESDNPFNQLIPEPDWASIPNEKGELPVKADHPFVGLEWPSTGKQDNRWYNWRLENWGTKWGPSPDSIDIDDQLDSDFVTLFFTTPWGPPEKVFEKLQEMDYDVTWHWDVPEETVCGYL